MLRGKFRRKFFSMFTKKFLFLGVAVVLALLCVGTISSFAATATPAQRVVRHAAIHYWNRGIPALPLRASSSQSLLSRVAIVKYLTRNGFIGAKTLSGRLPVISTLHFTNLSNLNSLHHIFVPGTPLNSPVYYARFNGPFILPDHPPLTLLSVLIPDSQTFPLLHILHNTPLIGGFTLQNGFTGIGDFSGLSNVANLGSLDDLTSGLGIDHILDSVFAIFDAHNGNLLAWG